MGRNGILYKCKHSLGRSLCAGTPFQSSCSARLILVPRVPCWRFHEHSPRWWLVPEHSQPGGWHHPIQTVNADSKRREGGGGGKEGWREREEYYSKHTRCLLWIKGIWNKHLRLLGRLSAPEDVVVIETHGDLGFSHRKANCLRTPHTLLTAHGTREQQISLRDSWGWLPSQFLPVYSLVSFRSHPAELLLDRARYWCERRVHQIAPAGFDGSAKE